MDENSIPIDYELSNGNTNKFEAMIRLVNRIKNTYGSDQLIVVAGAGLNSRENLAALKNPGGIVVDAAKFGTKYNTNKKKAAHDVSTNFNITAKKVAAIYKNLWHIDDFLQASKFQLEGYPHFAWTRSLLDGYFLSCFISFMIERYMLFSLEKQFDGRVNRRMNQSFGSGRTRLVFYDVTNTYFENTMSDKEKDYERADFAEIVVDSVKQAVLNEEPPADCLDSEGNVIVENLPASFIEKLADDKYHYFRMRGPSKEHRFDLPLVSIALIIDQNGIPLDFQFYAGNASEFAKMPESIRKLKEKYDIEEAVVVADRGLNSVENLTMLNGNNLGFLMAQKVTKLGETPAKKMLERSLYRPMNYEVPDDNLYQVVPDWEKPGENGSKINCTLVFTFNKKRQERDLAVLKLWQGIVLAKMRAGVKIGSRKTGWACLAKTEKR